VRRPVSPRPRRARLRRGADRRSRATLGERPGGSPARARRRSRPQQRGRDRVGSGPAAAVVKDATTTIPIVLASSFYPVEAGIIQSLAIPGGNVTGVTHFTPELMARRVQLVKELLPKATRIAVLRLPGRLQDLVVRDMTAAARQLGIQLRPIEVRREEDLAAAFATAAKGRTQAVMSTQGPFFWRLRSQIAQLAVKHRLPSRSGEPAAAEPGSLLFYGPDVMEGCQRAARYVDRILEGAKAGGSPRRAAHQDRPRHQRQNRDRAGAPHAAVASAPSRSCDPVTRNFGIQTAEAALGG
jgi:ABC-type uncharacterized transport system substrate-binding protein